MAIEDIFKALEEQAEAESRAALEAAEAQAKAIGEDAADEAEAIKARKVEQVRAVVEPRAARMVNAARLENRKEVAGVKDSAIERVYAGALEKLAAMRKGPEYAATFRALAEEALAGVEGEAVVQVDPADVALAEKTVRDLGVKGTVEGSLSTAGGLVVVSGGGRVFRRNTFEDRLGKVRKMMQTTVSEILFS